METSRRQNDRPLTLQLVLSRTTPGEIRIAAIKEYIKTHNVITEIGERNQDGFSLIAQAGLLHCESKVIEELVRAGASMGGKEAKGMSLLHTMVVHQRHAAINTFLKLGANWFGEWKGHNALWFAIRHPYQNDHAQELYDKIIENLVQGHPGGSDAAVKFKESETGRTALHVAGRYGNKEVAKKLIIWGAVVDEVDDYHHTPLWLAAANGHVDTAMLLINAGAKVDAIGKEGSTPLRVASRNGGVGKDTKPNFIQMCALLLANGANARRAHLSKSEAVGATQQALTLASSDLSRIATSASTLDAAEPNTGRTALHEAAFSGDFKAVMRLVDLGANINCRDRVGMTPLELAVYRNDFRDEKHKKDNSRSIKLEKSLEVTAVQFVDLGSDIGTEAQGRQLIWIAASNGWYHLIRALETHPKPGQSCKGAHGSELLNSDPYWHGCPALWIAVQRGHVEVVRVLLHTGSNPLTYFSSDCRYTNGPWLKALVPSHGDKSKVSLIRGEGKRKVNGKDLIGGEEVWMRGVQKVRPPFIPPPDGTCSVHQAALNGHSKILKLFIEYSQRQKNKSNLFLNIGVEYEGSEMHSSTPLHYAALGGWLNCCRLLIKAGANVNAQNKSLLTPLLLVITSPLKDTPPSSLSTKYIHDWANSEQVAMYLVSWKSDVNMTDWMGRSSVQLAAERHFNLKPNKKLKEKISKIKSIEDKEYHKKKKEEYQQNHPNGIEKDLFGELPLEVKKSPEAFSEWMKQVRKQQVKS